MATKFIKILFILSIAVLFILAFLTYRQSVNQAEAGNWVIHTHKVQTELSQYFGLVKDVESKQRGYILSADTSFLTHIVADKSAIRQSFNELLKLTADNGEQAKLLAQLQKITALRFAVLDSTTANYENNRTRFDLLTTDIKKGAKLMNNIDALYSILYNNETTYLKQRQDKYKKSVLFTPMLMLFFFMFCLFIFIISYFKIDNELLLKQTALEKQMVDATIMQQAEELGRFFTWQWDIETGVCIFSQNIYTILGLKPTALEHSVAGFAKLVHPDDAEKVSMVTNEVIEKKIPVSAVFRMIHTDGSILHVKSIGKLMDDNLAKNTIVGLTIDITKDYLYSQAIIAKNSELKAINEELSAFTHVTSHDLQEPLRKIEIFTSRINEADVVNMSPAGQVIIDKVKFTVTRMRKLINDLLAYTTANKDQANFELSDLNTIVARAMVELSTAIEEKNATLQVGKLPMVNVISFQIQQLFCNLINNALKYSRRGIPPIISIAYTKVNAENIDGLLDGNGYHKFTITDNGIGFDNAYAKSIFTLFNRLHGQNVYTGSGIGLAICKKIIDNHNGTIYAESNNVDGSVFTFYLPAS